MTSEPSCPNDEQLEPEEIDMARKKTIKPREATRPREPRRPRPTSPKQALAAQPSAEMKLEFPFGFPLEAVHCPGCGERVVSVEGTDCCPHTLYVFHSDVPEPLLMHPRLEEVVGSLDDDVPLKDQVERYLAAKPSVTAIPLSITTGGMACGPVWSTLRVRFELQGVEPWLDEDEGE